MYKSESFTLIWFALACTHATLGHCPQNWTSLGDTLRCYKIVQRAFLTFSNAVSLCKHESGKLLTIHSPLEQQLVSSWMYENNQVLDNVWLNAIRINVSNEFKWLDGEATFRYSNWGSGYPSNDSLSECVQMSSGYNRVYNVVTKGQWTNAPCQTRKLVVCERVADLSMRNLYDLIMQTRNQMIPPGFIYVQLPSQPEPLNMWPMFHWIEATKDYAGLFFRAEGGGSLPFGVIQSGDAPRLTKVEFDTSGDGMDDANIISFNIDVPVGEWSNYVSSQNAAGQSGADEDDEYMRFFVQDEEVRPSNTAVLIWKRV